MDGNYRYSKSFFNDGFSINIKLNNDHSKLISFQSSVTVDHVKYEIFKQCKDVLGNENRQDFFLALNRNRDLLQIEFVKFIFAHEDIQKCLLTKQPVQVYLLPKSKEIKARKHKADIIKKQLGVFKANVNSKSYNNLNNFGGSNKTLTTNDTIQTKSLGDLSKVSPSQSRRKSLKQQLIQQDITNTELNLNSIDSSSDPSSSPKSRAQGLGDVLPEIGTSSTNLNEYANNLKKRGTFGLNNIKSGDSDSLDPSILNQLSISPSLVLPGNNGGADNLSPRRRSLNRSILTDSMEDEERVVDEQLRLKLQQQLVQLEDEELKYQQTQPTDSDLDILVLADSEASDYSESETSDKEVTTILGHPHNIIVTPSSPSLSSSTGDNNLPHQQPHSPTGSTLSIGSDGKPVVRKSVTKYDLKAMVAEKSNSSRIKSSELHQAIASGITAEAIKTTQPQSEEDSTTAEEDSTTVEEEYDEDEDEEEEDNEKYHWTRSMQYKSTHKSKANKTAIPHINQDFPVQVSILSKESSSLIINCPKISSTSEFKSHLIQVLEQIISSVKVGTFAVEYSAQDIVPINSNSVIHNFVETTLEESQIPKLLILKPGMHEILLNALNENQQPQKQSTEQQPQQQQQQQQQQKPLSPDQQENQQKPTLTSSQSVFFKPAIFGKEPSSPSGVTSDDEKELKVNQSFLPPSTSSKPIISTIKNNIVTQYSSSPRNQFLGNSGNYLINNKISNRNRDGSPLTVNQGKESDPSQNNNNNNSLAISERRGRNGTMATFSLGEQRDQSAKQREHLLKAMVQKKKLAQIQIGSLLGKPICWSNEESEIKHFRELMENLFDFNNLDSRDRVKITMATITNAPADPLLPSTLRIKFYLPPDNHSTTISVNTTDMVSQVVERIIDKHNHTTKLLQDQKATDFIVRISGTSDHILRDCEIGHLEVVRQRLQRRKDIKFSLIHKKSLPSIYIDGYTIGLNVFQQNQLNNNNSHQSIQPLQKNLLTLPAPSPSSSTTTSPIMSPLIQSQTIQHPSNQQQQQGNIQRSILLYEINRPFEIRIICLENLNNQMIQHFLSESGVGTSNINDVKLTISMGLYYGEELLSPKLETFHKPSSNPLWCEWLRSTLLMSDIPRASKLCFTVYAQTEKAKVSIGWVDLQLIDYKSQLQSGVISLILWPGDKTSTSDYQELCPSLVFELLQFPFPVLFPRSELMDRGVAEVKDYVEARKQDEDRLQELIHKDPLSILSPTDRKFIWTYRMYLRKFPYSLPKVLQSLHWNNPQEVKEAHRLLSVWPLLSPYEALELLDVKFADELVREYAVNCLRCLGDSELALFLLQLVQSLKHEPYHDSALSRFLIQRALLNRSVIGHPFFWHLEAEMHNIRISDRYSLILETYLKGCGDQRHEFVKQMEVVTKLTTIAKLIKETSSSKRKHVLQDELSKLSLPNTFHLPTSASTESCGLLVSECRWLDSFTVPLWLVFQNVDPVGDPIVVIFKHGDDLRQDILTLQMMTLMDSLWKKDGLDTHMSIYNVTATGDGTGFIDVVSDSDTVANIQKAAGGVTAAFTKTPLANWLKDRNPNDQDYEFAQQNFINSLSGYCVATYILGISDRHNDNIMVSNSGHLFHIDFAHFLGNIMKFHGYKREKAPFVLTPEFAHVMGGEKSKSFKWFTELCCLSYNIIRKQRNLFIILFNLMLSTGIPELSTRNDIDYLREAFLMDLDDEAAKEAFARLIQKSLKTKTTQVMFALHILAHSDKPEESQNK